ncbi:MFS transporter [Jonesia quinghaiensis]|uniref:MFS transporter n=1 Tax=Jonesia quinghaiensis TaxID=262806 RepID=UPI00041B24A9|nr:MFS transporter [Jonesia quinghaiensis]
MSSTVSSKVSDVQHTSAGDRVGEAPTTVVSGGVAARRGEGAPRISPTTRVLLSAQLMFNVGFYTVVPFIALILRDEFALAGVWVGVVLGLRTFAQQGMFLFGGLLADRFGPRRLILLGCVVRIIGFLGLAVTTHFPVFLAGVLLTGLGGALFSPAVEALIGRADSEQARAGRRTTLFASLAFFGEIGAVLGPLLGALLLPAGYSVIALAGAGIFTVILAVLALALPTTTDADARPTSTSTPQRIPRSRPFIAFCAVASVNLLAFNQLYVGMPVMLRNAGADDSWLGVLFAVVSAVTIAGQLPIAAAMGRLPRPAAFRIAYGTIALSFVLAAVFSLGVPGIAQGSIMGSLPAAAPAIITAVVLVTGTMMASPLALSTVPLIASTTPGAAHYGLLATMGGIAVLIGNTALGPLYDLALTPQTAAILPWLALTLAAVAAAITLPRIVHKHSVAAI